MLVPQNRLLAAVAAVVLPLAVAGGLRADWSGPAAAGCACVLAVAGLDAALGLRRAGRALTFTLEPVVRLVKDRPGALPLGIANTRPGTPARALRLGLAWPENLTAPHDELAVTLAAGVEHTRLDWPCTGRRRGVYGLARIYYEERSPLGAWTVRRSAPAGPCEVRVYPDLGAERRQAAVFLTRGRLGSHARRQVGRGRDFEKLRDYIPGDDLQDISWKATARRQRPVSKVFQIERTQEVYVILDRSRLSAQPVAGGDPSPGGVTALEKYVSATLLLCLAAEGQGDLFGLASFAEGVDHFLRAKSGPAHFQACREAIYALEPAGVSPDFEEVCAALRGRLRRRALLVILTSSLDDPVLGESFARAIAPLSRQHLIRVNTLRPEGVSPLFSDPDGGQGVRGTEEVYRRLGGHLRWQRLRERENGLKRLGVGFTLLDPARLSAAIITQYLDVKGRQVL